MPDSERVKPSTGYMNNKDKPTPIARETLNALEDAKLKQSGKSLSDLDMCCSHHKRDHVIITVSVFEDFLFFYRQFLC